VTERRAGLIRRIIHWMFEASLVIKGTLTAAEALAGVVLLTSNARLMRLVNWLIATEIAEDPSDPVALEIEQMVHHLSIQTQHFYALYLIGHGGLKLLMVLGLAARLLWAYPLSMALLAGFAGYEFWGYLDHGSWTLLLLGLLDCFMIWLVWREYLVLKATRAASGQGATA
jgi:uncharacterized membrane protein